MSATVIVAADYGTAATVAAQLGLGQDWLYPHSIEQMAGRAIGRVVDVEGWQRSSVLTPEAVAAVVARMTPDATERRVSLGEQFDMLVSAPFVEAVTHDGRRVQAQHALRRRPRIGLAGFVAIGTGAALAASGAAVAVAWIIGWLP